MDFYVDMAASIILRILKDQKQMSKYRRIFLKIFAAIANAYASDAEFVRVMEDGEVRK